MGFEFDISDRSSFDDIVSYEDSAGPYEGFFYVLDLNGEDVKIGSSSRPSKRMLALTHIFRDYSDMTCQKVYISSPHVNYRDNETALLELFKNVRKPSTEICHVRYSDVLSVIDESICLTRVTSEYIKEKEDAFQATKNGLMRSLGFDKDILIRKFYRDEAYASMFSFILSEDVSSAEALYFVELIERNKEYWLPIFANSFQCCSLMEKLQKWGIIYNGSELMNYYNKSQADEFLEVLLGKR